MKAIIGINEYELEGYYFVDNGGIFNFTSASVAEIESAIQASGGTMTIEDDGSVYDMTDYAEVRQETDGIFIGYMSKEDVKLAELEQQVQEVVSETTFVHIRASQSDVVIPAKERTNIEIPLVDVPEGYVFGAYRGVALGGRGTGFHKCAFQMFDSSGGGTKANISIVNFSEEEVTVDVNVTIMFMRDFGGSK